MQLQYKLDITSVYAGVCRNSFFFQLHSTTVCVNRIFACGHVMPACRKKIGEENRNSKRNQ